MNIPTISVPGKFVVWHSLCQGFTYRIEWAGGNVWCACNYFSNFQVHATIICIICLEGKGKGEISIPPPHPLIFYPPPPPTPPLRESVSVKEMSGVGKAQYTRTCPSISANYREKQTQATINLGECNYKGDKLQEYKDSVGGGNKHSKKTK